MNELNESTRPRSILAESLIEADQPTVSQAARLQIEQWLTDGEQLTLTPVIIDVLMKVYRGLIKQAANNSFSAEQYSTGIKRQEPATADNSLLATERIPGLLASRLSVDGSTTITILANDGRSWGECIPSFQGNGVVGVIVENSLPEPKE